MERYCKLKDKFLDLIDCELTKDVSEINTHELYEVVDMLKDMTECMRNNSETKYYCSVVGAMNKEDTMRMAHKPDIVSRMYYSPMENFASLREYSQLVESGADSVSRANALQDFLAKFSEDINEINMSTAEKTMLKQKLANM